MSSSLNYETYILISSKKIIISVNSDLNKKIYEKELIIEHESKEFPFDKIDYLLNENILKIEKELKSFVNKVSVILDLEVFFPVEISLKKKSYKDIINLKNINNILYEAKDCCNKTIDGKKIVHIIINNYEVDNKSYSLLPNNMNCDSFSLDIKFISISKTLIKNLEKTLKKYQISIKQVLSANYIKKFLTNDEQDIFLIAKKIADGYNPNEVKLVSKTIKNPGFFEKFFNFFG